MNKQKRVLLSWAAFNNDPFERDRRDRSYIRKNGMRIPGPTLNLLFDKNSEYRNKIDDVVLLYREQKEDEEKLGREVFEETKEEIRVRGSKIRVISYKWDHDDPTDLKAIYNFLKQLLPKIRKQYSDHEIIVHISPGTGAMQTIWILMAETGFIEQPFKMVMTLREADRKGRPPVVPVSLDIETFYKAYKRIKPRIHSTEEASINWDPAQFVTKSLKDLYTKARRISSLKVPVMILGERGTGKTTLANWIRINSPYRKEKLDEDWPIVVCGQYTPDTMRVELFGYVKGAFTDAKDDKDGLLVKANQDTLFLDEIGDISKDLQRLIIKAVEEKIFTPIGSGSSLKSDFRLITATNLDWDKIVKKLDPDFLDRISLLRLTVPPLREIPDDIPWIWESVYEQALIRSCVNTKKTKLTKKQNAKIVGILKKHPLPGNLRDMYQIAYNLISYLSDTFVPISSDDAIDFALFESDLKTVEQNESATVAKNIARCFAENMPLDRIIDCENKLNTKEIDKELKKYFAKELERISKVQSVPLEKLCDVNKRTIHNWK